MRHVIVGGSIAGISAAKAIRSIETHAEITLVSEERGRAYYRPMIPFLIEKGDVDITFEEDPTEKYGMRAVYERADGIDTDRGEVILSSGIRIGFDRLLIASGGSPVVPEIPGLRGSGLFCLRTREDADRIRAYIGDRREALVLGGGLVGIKAACALRHRGLDVTVVEQRDRILVGRLDRRGAQIILTELQEAGIPVVTDDTIEEVMRARNRIEGVRLASGRVIGGDLVILAVGVTPRVDFLQGSGIDVHRGVTVDERLQTSLPRIYAAGDVVEYTDLVTNAPSLSGLWTNAEEMGRCAGRSMAGEEVTYPGFLSVMNATQIFGIPFISVGLIEPDGGDYEVAVDDRVDGYRKLVFQNDYLVGAVFLGRLEQAGIYTNLIRNRIPIGGLKEEAIEGRLGYVHFLRSFPEEMQMA